MSGASRFLLSRGWFEAVSQIHPDLADGAGLVKAGRIKRGAPGIGEALSVAGRK